MRPYPDIDSARIQVSRGGGTHPLWSPNGDELFYLDLQGGTFIGTGRLLSVPVDTSEEFRPGVPEVVINGGVLASNQGWMVYDYSPDQERFLMVRSVAQATGEPTGAEVFVLENWFDELERLVPTE